MYPSYISDTDVHIIFSFALKTISMSINHKLTNTKDALTEMDTMTDLATRGTKTAAKCIEDTGLSQTTNAKSVTRRSAYNSYPVNSSDCLWIHHHGLLSSGSICRDIFDCLSHKHLTKINV